MTDTTRLAVPSMGAGGLEGQRSGHFGRCDCFTLVDLDKGEIVSASVVDNPPHVEGGCLTPVQLLADHGVTALVVAGMGARPFAGFKDACIDVYFEDVTPIIGDIVALLAAGKVPLLEPGSLCSGH